MATRINPNKILIVTTSCMKCPSWITALKTRPDIMIIDENNVIFNDVITKYNVKSAPYYIDIQPETQEVLFETDDLYELIKFLKI